MGALIQLAGETFADWSVVERAGRGKGGRALWLCECQCGSRSIVAGSDLRNGSSTNCGCRRREKVGALNRGRTGRDHPAWREEVEYVAAHSRVRSARGVASMHACVDCSEPAEDWSYRGGCLNERISVTDKPGRRFSPNPDMYDPRCRTCHWLFDGRDETRGEGGRFAHI